MEKLELKHLAGYLPYGLKWSLQELKTFEMQGITPTTLYTKEGTVLNWEKHPDLPQALFPILRPLSDLTKEIEVNGEKFVPMGKLKNGGTDLNEYRYLEWKGYSACDNEEHETCYDEKSKSFLQSYRGDSRQCGKQLEKFQKLLEWHFDIYGLIEKGLAIDINKI